MNTPHIFLDIFLKKRTNLLLFGDLLLSCQRFFETATYKAGTISSVRIVEKKTPDTMQIASGLKSGSLLKATGIRATSAVNAVSKIGLILALPASITAAC